MGRTLLPSRPRSSVLARTSLETDLSQDDWLGLLGDIAWPAGGQRRGRDRIARLIVDTKNIERTRLGWFE